VSLVGSWDKDSVDKLAACEAELSKHKDTKFVILYFREVPSMTLDAISFLTAFQKRIRDKYTLRICSLHPELRQKLSKMGVVRGMELTDNLQTTLLDLKKIA
jgi:anti-anti-sigma regulatory factor